MNNCINKVLLMGFIAGLIFCSKPQKPSEWGEYSVLSGELQQKKLPALWEKYQAKKVVTSIAPNTKYQLADGSYITLNGTLAIGKQFRQCALINGKANFEVAADAQNFHVAGRAGKVEAKSGKFAIAVRELAAKSSNIKIGDNPAQMTVRPESAPVSILAFGKKKPQFIAAGAKKSFKLGEVRRQGNIQALGFGISNRPGRLGMQLKKRTALITAKRALQEFIGGMEFAIVNDLKNALQKAKFNSSGTIQMANAKVEYEPLDEQILMATIYYEAKRVNAVARRNAKLYNAQGESRATAHANIAKAIFSARNNAIVKLIRQAASEIYGTAIPGKLFGRFYPQSFQVEKKAEQLLATMSGEVIFR